MGRWEEDLKRYDGSPVWLNGEDHDNPGGYVRNTEAPTGHGIGWAPDRSGFSDQVVCECGWKSLSFWDGRGYAIDDWEKHHLAELTGSQAILEQGGGL